MIYNNLAGNYIGNVRSNVISEQELGQPKSSTNSNIPSDDSQSSSKMQQLDKEYRRYSKALKDLDNPNTVVDPNSREKLRAQFTRKLDQIEQAQSNLKRTGSAFYTTRSTTPSSEVSRPETSIEKNYSSESQLAQYGFGVKKNEAVYLPIDSFPYKGLSPEIYSRSNGSFNKTNEVLPLDVVRNTEAKYVDYGVTRQSSYPSKIPQGEVKPTSEIDYNPSFLSKVASAKYGVEYGSIKFASGILVSPLKVIGGSSPAEFGGGADYNPVTGRLNESGVVYQSNLVSSAKVSGSDVLNTALIGLSQTRVVGNIIVSGITVSGLVSAPSRIASSSSPFEFGSNIAETGIYLLGARDVRTTLNINSFNTNNLLAGTIKTSPSVINENVRAVEFLKERGISPNTFDTTNTLSYASSSPKEYVQVGTMVKNGLEIPILNRLETPEPRQSRVVSVPQFRPSIQKIIVDNSAVPKEVYPNGVRKEYVFEGERGNTALITREGLQFQSSGTLPLIEVSKYPFEKQTVTLQTRGGEFQFSPIEYSEYLKREFPQYQGVGFDVSKGNRGEAFMNSAGNIYVNVDLALLDSKKGSEVISRETALSYAGRGRDIFSLVGKSKETSFESTLAHELIHVEDFISKSDMRKSEARAIGFQVNAFESKVAPRFLVSKDVQLRATSNTVNEPSLSEVMVESNVASAQRPLVIKNVDVGVSEASLPFNRIDSSSVASEVVSTSRGNIVFESKPSESMPSLKSFEPLNVKLIEGSESVSIDVSGLNINPSKSTVKTSSFRTVKSNVDVESKSVSIDSSTSSINLEVQELKPIELISESKASLESKSELIPDIYGVSESRVDVSQSSLSGYTESLSSTGFSGVKSNSFAKFESVPSFLTLSNTNYKSELNYASSLRNDLGSSSIGRIDSSSRFSVALGNGLELSPSIDNIQDFNLKSGLEQKQSLESKQSLEQKQIFDTTYSTRISSSSRFNVNEIITEPPIQSGKFSFDTTNKKKGSKSKLFVKRKGKFELKGEGEDLGLLFKRGKDILQNTASASFKVISESGSAILPNILPNHFYESKRNKGTIVQARENRINTAGEKMEITRKGIDANRRRLI